MAILVTDTRTFTEGDFPEICALTGQPATEKAAISGDSVVSPSFKELLMGPFGAKQRKAAKSGTITGYLPVAAVVGLDRIHPQWHEESDRVVIRGLSDDFLTACREQGKAR